MLVQSRIFHQLSDLFEFLLNSGQIARLQVVAVPAGCSHAIDYLLHVGAKAGPLIRRGLPALVERFDIEPFSDLSAK